MCTHWFYTKNKFVFLNAYGLFHMKFCSKKMDRACNSLFYVDFSIVSVWTSLWFLFIFLLQSLFPGQAVECYWQA
jgi:hypothetical protein